jgi:hypothetical protein
MFVGPIIKVHQPLEGSSLDGGFEESREIPGGRLSRIRKIEATIEQHPSAANAKKEWGILFWVVWLVLVVVLEV